MALGKNIYFKEPIKINLTNVTFTFRELFCKSFTGVRSIGSLVTILECEDPEKHFKVREFLWFNYDFRMILEITQFLT